MSKSLEEMTEQGYPPHSCFDNIDDGKADCDGSNLHEDDAELNYTLQPESRFRRDLPPLICPLRDSVKYLQTRQSIVLLRRHMIVRDASINLSCSLRLLLHFDGMNSLRTTASVTRLKMH